MINLNNLYTYSESTPLIDGEQNQIGLTIIHYEIKRYRDVRNLQDALAYQVSCSQRIVIPNATPYAPGPQYIQYYDSYPAIVQNNIEITNTNGLETQLIDYSPRTVNSAVTKSASSATGEISSASHEHSNGSTTSQSNTFGTSVSAGFFGDALTGGVSASYSSTHGSSQSHSATSGNSSGASSNSTGGESMSIKDWACNSYLGVNDTSPTWVWGQEYPWNVLKYNNANVVDPTEESPILLPKFVIPLLCDDTQALPPSQLSLYGIDFTMTSRWIIKPDTACSISIAHDINYFTASHTYVPKSGSTPPTVHAHISTASNFSIAPTSIDLCTYGLDPIEGPDNPKSTALIGFVPNKFVVNPLPVSSGLSVSKLKTISSNNTLLINDTSTYQLVAGNVGAGFSVSETALDVKFTSTWNPLELTLNFKIADTTDNYTLYIKHWKTHDSDILLELSINGDITLSNFITCREAEGGDSNLLSVNLRNLDYGSIDYHDFLMLGLNTVVMKITPVTADVACGYQIRAISIEKNS